MSCSFLEALFCQNFFEMEFYWSSLLLDLNLTRSLNSSFSICITLIFNKNLSEMPSKVIFWQISDFFLDLSDYLWNDRTPRWFHTSGKYSHQKQGMDFRSAGGFKITTLQKGDEETFYREWRVITAGTIESALQRNWRWLISECKFFTQTHYFAFYDFFCKEKNFFLEKRDFLLNCLKVDLHFEWLSFIGEKLEFLMESIINLIAYFVLFLQGYKRLGSENLFIIWLRKHTDQHLEYTEKTTYFVFIWKNKNNPSLIFIEKTT